MRNRFAMATMAGIVGLTLFGCAAGDPMRRSAENGNYDKVQQMLDAGTPVDQRDHDDETALHGAAQAGDVAIAKLLLNRGAKVNAVDEDGDTPLHFAARAGHVEMLQFLLDHGAQIDAKNHDRETPLHVAVANDHPRAADLLMARGAAITGQLGEGTASAARTGSAPGVVELPPPSPEEISVASLPASQVVTIKGPISEIDGHSVKKKALGLAEPDPIKLAPGLHKIRLGAGISTNSTGIATLSLNLHPGQYYQLKYADLGQRVNIINLTTGHTIHFDCATLVYFDDNRQPIAPPPDGYAP